MDIREQEQLQHLGFFGIFKQAYKLTYSQWKPIFSRITLALILPFCLLIFADMHLSNYLLGKAIIGHQVDLLDMPSDDPEYDQIKHKLVREWALFSSFSVFYFFLGLLVFYLFSISAVVYTVACVYTSKTTTLKKVMRIVPKVWKKLVITFFWNVLILFVYHVVAIVLLVLSIALAVSNEQLRVLGIALAIIVVIVYVLGVIYINVIWHLASVVSVLEDTRGLRAMKKGRSLVKGKMMVTGGIYVVFQVVLIGIQFGYFVLVAALGRSPVLVLIHMIVAMVCFLGILKLVLLGLVVQSIVYFVCKSYHQERIEQSGLDAQLEGYLGTYGRLGGEGKDVQLEQV